MLNVKCVFPLYSQTEIELDADIPEGYVLIRIDIEKAMREEQKRCRDFRAKVKDQESEIAELKRELATAEARIDEARQKEVQYKSMQQRVAVLEARHLEDTKWLTNARKAMWYMRTELYKCRAKKARDKKYWGAIGLDGTNSSLDLNR